MFSVTRLCCFFHKTFNETFNGFFNNRVGRV
jgi:hypothetical protein